MQNVLIERPGGKNRGQTLNEDGVTLSLAASNATGRFMVDADIVLFPNSATNGYGVMFGGQGTTSADTTLGT